MFNIPSFGFGFVIGFGAGFVSREITSATKATIKPVAKEVIRSGMQALDKSREAFAHIGEAIEDLVAEVRSEKARTETPTTSKVQKKVSAKTN